MFDEDLINGDSLHVKTSSHPCVATFKLRLPWYRSLHLSSVERIAVQIDGRPVDTKDISLTIYGVTYPFRDLVQRHDVLWFVLDAAELSMPLAAPPRARTCEVTATLFIRIPYRRASDFREIGTCSRTLAVSLER